MMQARTSARRNCIFTCVFHNNLKSHIKKGQTRWGVLVPACSTLHIKFNCWIAPFGHWLKIHCRNTSCEILLVGAPTHL